jgi:hypothetical protein
MAISIRGAAFAGNVTQAIALKNSIGSAASERAVRP